MVQGMRIDNRICLLYLILTSTARFASDLGNSIAKYLIRL